MEHVKTCSLCNEEFSTTDGRRTKCYKEHTSVCPSCGEEFPADKKQKYCSLACASKSPSSPSVTNTCSLCSKEFSSPRKRQICDDPHEATCTQCGKTFLHKQKVVERFPKTCSPKCAASLAKETNSYSQRTGFKSPFHDPSVQEKVRKTLSEKYAPGSDAERESKERKKRLSREKYGTDSPMSSEVVKEKRRRESLEKTGFESPFHNPEVQDKVKVTNREVYGVENQFAREEVQEAIRKTNLEKHGDEVPARAEHVKAKARQTFVERYGVTHPMLSSEVKEEARARHREQYGVDYPMQREDVRERVRQSAQDRYGRDNSSQVNIDNFEDWVNFEEWATEYSAKQNGKISVFDVSKYFNVGFSSAYSKIRTSGLSGLFSLKISSKESKYREFFSANGFVEGVDFTRNDRSVISPKELDFYFPNHKLAIEISPTATHSTSGVQMSWGTASVPKHYHVDKARACEAAGVQLITVFDWHDDDKIFSFLLHKLSRTPTKLAARKCSVKLIDREDPSAPIVRDFLEENHILGFQSRGVTHFTVLYHGEELVGAAAYRPISGKSYAEGSIELVRLVFKQGVTVRGGASRLLKTFTRTFPETSSVITFSDFDLGGGHIYQTLGFSLSASPRPGAQYVHPSIRTAGGAIWKFRGSSLPRVGADRLLKNFPEYEPVGLECKCESVTHANRECLPSNEEVVLSHGFTKVYDCGYKKWVLGLTASDITNSPESTPERTSN